MMITLLFYTLCVTISNKESAKYRLTVQCSLDTLYRDQSTVSVVICDDVTKYCYCKSLSQFVYKVFYYVSTRRLDISKHQFANMEIFL